MPSIEIISETPISMIELKDKLNEIKKRDNELTPRANKTLDYLNQFSKTKIGDFNKLKEKIIALNIPRLKERHVCKIIDVYPEDIDSLKAMFSGENIQPKQEDLNRILTLLNEK
ncbi:hypothetical protein J4214_02870 [Candidatus Woesearchaeota archaeon]|nr:hypothetical protein [Candidatus Woesearchaeota archaeon]